MKNLTKFGIRIPNILLPKDTDLSTWSVIACDQYTQDADYWKEAEKLTEGKPSTLNLIFPEVYLNKGKNEEIISRIQNEMQSYINNGVFSPEEKECIYIERKTEYGRTRKGLVTAIDLETYEWKPGSKALIRATEATVPERIPPRMKIREGAALELPHIMLLADDPEDLLIGGCKKLTENEKPIYDGDLMQNSGHITGWAVKGEKAENLIEQALAKLAEKGTDKDGSVFLFAVGDGNHSLATAKAVWEEHKKELLSQNKTEEELAESPVRYALVEIVNIYDTGLTFEPIHRVMFGFDSEELINYICKALDGTVEHVSDENTLKTLTESAKDGAVYGFTYTKDGNSVYKVIGTQIKELAISRLQPVLDDFIAGKNASKEQIDYIHGADEILELGKKDGATGILLPPVEKESFFNTINTRGPLPRKSFSMGEASEKRFYVEARKLF